MKCATFFESYRTRIHHRHTRCRPTERTSRATKFDGEIVSQFRSLPFPLKTYFFLSIHYSYNPPLHHWVFHSKTLTVPPIRSTNPSHLKLISLHAGLHSLTAWSHLLRQLISNSISLFLSVMALCSSKKVNVARARLSSVGLRSWSRFLAVSLQVMWVINPAVGCHYFPPGLQLPSQSLRGLLPVSLLDKQRHDWCEHFA